MHAARARRSAAHHSHLDTVLFVLLLAIYAAPLIALRHFPSQDGPAHVNNANVLRLYNDPDHSVLRRYYTVDYSPVPNWTGHILLAAAMNVVPPAVAEKLLVAIIALGIPLALRYALLAVAPEAGALALLVFPFVYGFPLHMGFYNFCIGVMLTFVAIGYALRRGGRLEPRHVVVLALLLLCMYFSHIVAWFMTIVALFGIVKWQAIVEWFTERPEHFASWVLQRVRGVVPLLIATLPSLALVFWYLTSPASAPAHEWPFPKFSDRFDDLIHFHTISVFHLADDVFSTSLAALFLLIAVSTVVTRVQRRTRWEATDAWGLFTMVLFLVFLFVPEGMAGGYYLSSRIQLYACLFALLWFATQPVPELAKITLRITAIGIAVGLLVLRWPAYHAIDAQITEYESAGDVIAPNATLLPIPFSQRAYTPPGKVLADNISFFLHTAGYIAAKRGLVTLDNYEANTAYFPVHFRSRLNPYLTIGTEVDGDFPPHAMFSDYTEQTGGRIDYVLIWRVFSSQRNKPDGRYIFDQLVGRYNVVAVSKPWGFARVYQRKQ